MIKYIHIIYLHGEAKMKTAKAPKTREAKKTFKLDFLKKINLKKLIKTAIIIGIIGIIVLMGLNIYIVKSTEKRIQSTFTEEYDCILVLGAGVRDGKPRPMLQDRLNYAIDLYRKGVAPKLLMSGDHGRKDYDEVNIMKEYAINMGVPSEDIFMDHAGFSTYESIYRARDIFKADKIIIVTQKYHLFRALYISERLGVEAHGYASDPQKYAGSTYREFREVLARNKDFVYCILKPKPTYLGEAIPVSGNGDLTND